MMLHWVPQEIIWKYGKVETSRINGDHLTLPLRRKDEIVAAFTAAGFECTSDQFLVRLIPRLVAFVLGSGNCSGKCSEYRFRWSRRGWQ
jgi:hypothetical protein